MSALGPRPHRVTLIVALLATIAITACDSPTQPQARLARARTQPANIEGDTLSCGNRGWAVIQGWYVCNDPQ